nr:hypothetical protein [Bradyrhizobium genosp. L]
MRPTTAHSKNVFALRPTMRRGDAFEHPLDVLRDNFLTTAEKRAILASWASDAAAVTSNPALRAPAGLKPPATVDEIRAALRVLDEGPKHPPGGKPARLRSTVRPLAA